jgi:F-type H+-transporting ATPase subunit delta
MDTRLARRYAKALFLAAQGDRQVQKVGDDLDGVMNALEQSGMMKAYLQNPRIPRSNKLARLNEVFGKEIQPVTLRLLQLLIRKRRETLLHAVYSEYQKLREEFEGVVRTTILSAVYLPEDQQLALIRKLETDTGKRLIPSFEVDSKLIGGVRVELGDYQIDGSVAGALDRLRDHVRLEIERRRTTR